MVVEQPLFAPSHGQTVVWHHDWQHSGLKTHRLQAGQNLLKSYFIKKQFFYKKVKNNSNGFFSSKTYLREKLIIRKFERERVIVKNCLSARKKTQSIPFLLPWWSAMQFIGRPQPNRLAAWNHCNTPPNPKSLSFSSQCSFHNKRTKLIHKDVDRCLCSSCSMDKEIRAVN